MWLSKMELEINFQLKMKNTNFILFDFNYINKKSSYKLKDKFIVIYLVDCVFFYLKKNVV